jgi:hypothetical protein
MTAACLAVLLAAGVARTAPAPGGKTGLDQVPADSPIVIYLRGAQGTRDRLVAMMQNALPEVLKKFQSQMDDALENGIDGRKLRGVVKDGPIFLAFTELPKPGDNPPKMAVIVAVSNYKEFRDNILTADERGNIKANGAGVESVVIKSETTYFVDRKNYAIVTPSEEVANSFTKKQPGLDGKLSKELAGKLMAADVGVYVALDAINKEYAEQIKQARQGLEQLIDLGAAQAGKAEKSAIEMAKGMIGPVFQAVEDSQGVLLTFEFRPTGLALHVQSEVRGGSPTAQYLEGSRPAAFQDLARMPDGRTYYTALKMTPEMFKTLGGLLFGVMQDKDSKEAQDLKAAMDELAKAGPGVRMDAYSLPPAGLQVMRYEDPAKAIAAQLKMMQSLAAGGTIQSGTLKEKPVIKKSAQKYGDFELHSVQLVWDLDKMAEAAAGGQGEEAKKQLAKGFKQMMGDKLNIWLGTDGKEVVQVTAPDWPAAQNLLDQYFKNRKPIGDVKAFGEVRKEMPSQTSFLMVVDAVQYLGTVADALKPLFGQMLPQAWPAMPGKGTPSFVGVAVTLQPQRGSFDTFISAAAAHEFYKAFIKPVIGE